MFFPSLRDKRSAQVISFGIIHNKRFCFLIPKSNPAVTQLFPKGGSPQKWHMPVRRACAGKHGARILLHSMLIYFLLQFFYRFFGFSRVLSHTDSILPPTNFFVEIFICLSNHGQHQLQFGHANPHQQ